MTMGGVGWGDKLSPKHMGGVIVGDNFSWVIMGGVGWGENLSPKKRVGWSWVTISPVSMGVVGGHLVTSYLITG